MTTITIINNFHGTEARIRISTSIEDGGSVDITESQARRAMKRLCGMADCQCGGSRGGRYYLYHDEARNHAWITDRGFYA